MDTKTCPECQGQFQRPPDQRGDIWKRRVFCSRECYWESMRGGHRTAVEVRCPICQRGFYPKPSLVARGAGKHCSAQCAGIAHAQRIAGEGHPRWQGGRVVTRQGYVRVWVPDDHAFAAMRPKNQGGILEHRLVMAESLGRPLTQHETVHHINGDRQDNRLENLQLRNGRHGKGQHHRCRACGSSDIEHLTI